MINLYYSSFIEYMFSLASVKTNNVEWNMFMGIFIFDFFFALFVICDWVSPERGSWVSLRMDHDHRTAVFAIYYLTSPLECWVLIEIIFWVPTCLHDKQIFVGPQTDPIDRVVEGSIGKYPTVKRLAHDL